MQHEIADIRTDPPTAIKGLKNGMAAREDLILAELLKADIEFYSRESEANSGQVWRQEKTPER